MKVGDVVQPRGKGGSWWTGVSREDWRQAVEDEQERISRIRLDPTARDMATPRKTRAQQQKDDEEV